MIDLFAAIGVYLLAFVGLISVIILAVWLWMAYHYDVKFTVSSAKDKKYESYIKKD